jgi:fatty-acid desaturase
MMATAKTIAPDRPVLDWPAIFFLAIVHVGALAALLPGAFSWPAIGVAVFLHWPTGGAGVTLGCHPLITHRAQQPSRFPEFGSAGSALVARMEDQASALQGCDHRAEDMRALAHA